MYGYTPFVNQLKNVLMVYFCSDIYTCPNCTMNYFQAVSSQNTASLVNFFPLLFFHHSSRPIFSISQQELADGKTGEMKGLLKEMGVSWMQSLLVP